MISRISLGWKPVAWAIGALLGAVVFSAGYLFTLGHLRAGAIDPVYLWPGLVLGFLITTGMTRTLAVRVDLPEQWSSLAWRGARCVGGTWLACGVVATALIGAMGAPFESIVHLIGSITLLPAGIAGAAAYFVYEDVARDGLERAGVSSPPWPTGRGRARLRTRLVGSLLAATLLPLLLLANVMLHYQEHDRAIPGRAHEHGPDELPDPEAHTPLFALLALVGGAAGLAGVGFGFLASRSLSRPILALTSAMERVRRGDVGARVTVVSTDEAGRAAETFNAMVEGLAERAWLHETFGRYVSREVADALREGRIALDGEQLVVSVLFADIRGFTKLSEAMPPHGVLTFVNEYLRAMMDAIVSNRGRLDKVMGDGMMVVFGAPIFDSDHALNAIRAALAMQRALESFNAGRSSAGHEPVRIGIGIHTGEVTAGNVGVESHKMEFTVLGDTVNLASRVEGLTKELHAEILVTEATMAAAGGAVEADPMPDTIVRGKTAPVRTFAVRRLRDS